MLIGFDSPYYAGAISGGISYLDGTLPKSSGKWFVALSYSGRSGLTRLGFNPAISNMGSTGSDAVSFDGFNVRWIFGGVAGTPVLITPDPAYYNYAVFAIDLGTRVIDVYRREIATGTLVLAHSVTGIPVGSWVPGMQNVTIGSQAVPDVPGPVGYSAWEILT